MGGVGESGRLHSYPRRVNPGAGGTGTEPVKFTDFRTKDSLKTWWDGPINKKAQREIHKMLRCWQQKIHSWHLQVQAAVTVWRRAQVKSQPTCTETSHMWPPKTQNKRQFITVPPSQSLGPRRTEDEVGPSGPDGSGWMDQGCDTLEPKPSQPTRFCRPWPTVPAHRPRDGAQEDSQRMLVLESWSNSTDLLAVWGQVRRT